MELHNCLLSLSRSLQEISGALIKVAPAGKVQALLIVTKRRSIDCCRGYQKAQPIYISAQSECSLLTAIALLVNYANQTNMVCNTIARVCSSMAPQVSIVPCKLIRKHLIDGAVDYSHYRTGTAPAIEAVLPAHL